MRIFKICLLIFYSVGLYLGGSASYTLRYLFILTHICLKPRLNELLSILKIQKLMFCSNDSVS